jgi:ubiquinone/menaquinone biosynthesis C-methylase UbiE
VTELDEPRSRPRTAFATDRSAQTARALLKAAWWGAAGVAARTITGAARTRPKDFTPSVPPPPDGFLRRAWREAFDKDGADVAEGLYPPMDDAPIALRGAADVLADARHVEDRRRRGAATEARADVGAGRGYPNYYRQNFHFQTGGWFTPDSARRYESQVEVLFAGAAGAMRRRALSLLARAWRGRDHRGLAIVDLACGSGAFLADLAATFPRANLLGLDLSPAYLREAGRRSGVRGLIQANAERLPFADASLDAVTCVYLFHELPPRVRPVVAAEIARVLKPGGLLAFADSVQPVDEPRLARLLEAFPAYFHEPYYASYCATNLPALFAGSALRVRGEDRAFLTKAVLFEKCPQTLADHPNRSS